MTNVMPYVFIVDSMPTGQTENGLQLHKYSFVRDNKPVELLVSNSQRVYKSCMI